MPDCFICGFPMIVIRGIEEAWKCLACDVIEEHAPYVSHLSASSSIWMIAYGDIQYLDHSLGSYPSPA